MLDARPIRPPKRVPMINVAPEGNAKINLWCQTVRERVQIAEQTMLIKARPLPRDLPRYMIYGQCTPKRMGADLATLKFSPSDH